MVVHSLLTGDDKVESVLAVLKSLWLGFDALVSVQHVQDAILCVSGGVGGSRTTTAGAEKHFRHNATD